MRVAILADSPVDALRIFRETKELSGVSVDIVLTNQGNIRAHVRAWLTVVVRYPIVALEALASRRVTVLPDALDSPASITQLLSRNYHVGLHAAGVIYRRRTIECFSLGILNAHIGLLPKYRGRSVMEWSLVQGDPTGISVFFIDGGIDTGTPIVIRDEVPLAGFRSLADAKAFLFGLDGIFYARALSRLRDRSAKLIENGMGTRYFPMSSLLQSVALAALLERQEPP